MEQDTFSTVASEIKGEVLVVSINRPNQRNAIDGPTAQGLVKSFEEFEKNSALSVAILFGQGGNFCAGADLKAIGSGNGNRIEEDLNKPGPLGVTRMKLSKPVIAAVEGYAVAGGLELAIWCDLRVATPSSTFGVFCRRWGVPLVDGGTVRLPRLIGHSRAMDMILTGRGVGGVEAFEWGLVNRLADENGALKASIELAEKISAFPQLCMRNDRLSSYLQWGSDIDEAMASEVRLGLETIRSGETLEGSKRFQEGRGRHGQGV